MVAMDVGCAVQFTRCCVWSRRTPMGKNKKKRKKRPHPVIDLGTDAGRRQARKDLVWSDHGFLRTRFRNLHQISDEMWRSNQPSPSQIRAHVEERGIRTILNLRGPSPRGFYLLEKEVCEEFGVELIDFQVFSRDTPTVETINAARDLFGQIAYPALMHCKSGADRAGIMSVFYMIFRQGLSVAEAREQLSFKYLHVKQGKTGVLDAVFDAYEVETAGSGKSFIDWVNEDYDRLAIKDRFMESFGAKMAIDQLLRRE